ncbi:hypothetical protein P280DRAFT_286932 [Massarina eburnea CBS 473.64]|uniref:N-acetyltransferase domain-containing protein n=1 Tax=Massarina eburnea CBS 473.64 TaxID=1395130 RepID=A0A6A6S247_9PLEO|nr:hypothetical protein P280DRAFT_286932 [Massarina eburnea CBS 473.64]
MAHFARCSRDAMQSISALDTIASVPLHSSGWGVPVPDEQTWTWQEQDSIQGNRKQQSRGATPQTDKNPPRFQIQRTPQTQIQAPDKKMTPPPSAYVPPHLRNKSTSKQSCEATPVGTSAGSKSIAPEVRPVALPTPPVTSSPVEDGARTEEAIVEDFAVKWDPPRPPYVKPPTRNGNPRWNSNPPRRSKWPKQKDMKALPSNHNDDGGIDTEWARGWGVDIRSDSGGDPFYDVKKLTDWNGDWMPPPVDWMARNRFADRHFGEGIEKWMNGHNLDACSEVATYLEKPQFSSATINGAPIKKKAIETDYTTSDIPKRDRINANMTAQELAEYQRMKKAGIIYTTQDIAPRIWIPVKIEGCAPQHFWRDYSSRAPAALSDIDPTDPYWEVYTDNHCFITDPIAPKASLDMDDDINRNDPKARASTIEKMELMSQGKEKREKKLQARRNAPLPPCKPYQPPPPMKTLASFYLRPVRAADVEGIMQIYNYYVEKGISAPEFTPRTKSHMAARISTVTEETLPYIVAVDRGNGGFLSGNNFVRERIIGFASIDDYCDKGSMYRYTFELELFTHPGFVKKGIAGCLMDRLISTCSTGYQVKGGYDWINNGEYLKGDAERRVKTINCSVPHEEGSDVTWMCNFFKRFKFMQRGHLTKMGYKDGKCVDVSIFQHTTSEPIDAAARPVMPL